MNAKSTHLAMLACLTAGAAHANPGTIGGVDSRLENIPDHNFSTTTKLSGEVLFAGAFGEEGDSLGEASLFRRAGRFKLEPKLQGWNTSLTGAFGYTSHQQENTNNTDESAYYNLGARFLYGGSSGRLSYTTFEQSDVVSNYDGDHWLRWACGIGCEHDINDHFTVGLGCSLVLVDDDSYDDTYTSTSFRLKYDF